MSGPSTRRAATDAGVARPTVTVCRGCCCGTRKVPLLDHTAQLADLRQSLTGMATVRTTDCLDTCDHANVMVIQPSAQGRHAGGHPVWLGWVNYPNAIRDITAWITAGGPGIADPPEVLDHYTFTPPRRVRQALDN
ncbi:MAG: (2Fe-2S) ferredoxin domain-containing protein [Actinomycetota bacterium]|nr:(2Fe-2S) ferredoxin domain-containing protein [Actinomycetota bacterium]